MKILWSSNSGWCSTGYGAQTGLFAPLIRDAGHDVALFAFYGLNGGRLEWNGMQVYPGGTDAWGNDVLAPYATHHFDGDPRGGWVITLQDVWTLISPTLQVLRLASWCPVDHDPVPPAVVGYFQRYPGSVPIAMSRFGQKALEFQGLEPLYVPHAVDTTVFAPRTDRDEVRRAIGLPTDAFVVGMVAANKGIDPPRKAFAEVFEAFAKFKERRPSAMLYMHTLRTEGHQGVNLQFLAKSFGISEAIVWVDQLAYMMGDISPDVMAALYGTMDVLVNPSYGEGFGIPILEAQSCGVPVILADNTSMPELLGGGWLVPCTRYWHENQKSFYGRVVVTELAAAMEKAYQASAKVGRRAREFALGYDVEHVMAEHWTPALADLEARMTEEPHEIEPVDPEALRGKLELVP